MKAFYIDSCLKSFRVIILFAELLFVVIGDKLQIPWMYRYGLGLILILLFRNNTRYYFLSKKIEKYKCKTDYKDVHFFHKNGQNGNAQPLDFLELDNTYKENNRCTEGKLLHSYLKTDLQKVNIYKGLLFDTLLLQFSGCTQKTEHFLWLFSLRNRDKVILIRMEKNSSIAIEYAQLFEEYLSGTRGRSI
jgi:hypothetical protein